jgi:hypothetical protein
LPAAPYVNGGGSRRSLVAKKDRLSSATWSYIVSDASTYQAWLAAGNLPTTILCDGELANVLLDIGAPSGAAIAAGATSLGGLTPVDKIAVVTVMGCAITSTATPALNGTYAIDPPSQQAITSEVLYVQVTASQGAAKFTNGQTTKGWPDATGAPHTFTTAQFVAFAEGVGDVCRRPSGWGPAALAAGQQPTWPASPVAIV